MLCLNLMQTSVCINKFTLRKQPDLKKKSVNERMWKDKRGVRRRMYGGDVSLVFSWIHPENLREQRRGKESSTSGLFFSRVFSPSRISVCLPSLIKKKKERWLAGREERNGLENLKQTRSRQFHKRKMPFEQRLSLTLSIFCATTTKSNIA